MLSIAHGPIGAFLVKTIPFEYIAIPAALASHYLTDAVPHWDVGQGLSNHSKSKKVSLLQEIAIDLPLSIVITYFLFQHGHAFNSKVWLGWFIGLLPDFIEAPRLFFGQRWAILESHHRFHKWFHISTPNKFWGLLPQAVVLLSLLLLK